MLPSTYRIQLPHSCLCHPALEAAQLRPSWHSPQSVCPKHTPPCTQSPHPYFQPFVISAKKRTFAILLDMLPPLRTMPFQQGENAHQGIFREAGASPARTRRRDRGQGSHFCHCPKGWEDAWPRMIRESEDRPCSVHIVCAPTGTWAAALLSPPFPKNGGLALVHSRDHRAKPSGCLITSFLFHPGESHETSAFAQTFFPSAGPCSGPSSPCPAWPGPGCLPFRNSPCRLWHQHGRGQSFP